MQEQHPYKLTPEQGWSGMEPILDQAMPVPQRSRRFILFWWTMAAVMTAALVGYGTWMSRDSSGQLFTHTQSPSNTESVSTINPPIKDQSETPITTSDELIVKQQHVQKEIAGGESNNTNNAEVTKNQSQVKKDLNNVNSLSTTSHGHANALKENTIASLHSNDVKENNATIIESEVVINREPEVNGGVVVNSEIITESNNASEEVTNAEAATSDNSTTKSLTSVDFLPLTPIALYQESDVVMNVQPSDIKPPMPIGKKLISPYLSGSGMAGFKKSYGGHGSAGLDINLTPSLSLNADLGYAIYKPESSL
ncbi:MAG: hypothetical protein M3R25_05490, partial [Bacteroidota bacterium]|nr:hypothetical protein [Bacteroidota bacterium]